MISARRVAANCSWPTDVELLDHAAVSIFRVGGSFLVTSLLRTGALRPPTPRSDVPLDQKINIRIIRIINSLNAWCSTTRSTLAREAKANLETDVGRSETPPGMSATLSTCSPRWLSPRPCFRPPCSAGKLRTGKRRYLERRHQIELARAVDSIARALFSPITSQAGEKTTRSRKKAGNSLRALSRPPPSKPASSSAAGSNQKICRLKTSFVAEGPLGAA